MAFRSNRSQGSAGIARSVGEDVDMVRGALRSRAAKLKALCDRAEARGSFKKQADLAKAKLGGAMDKATAIGDLQALNRRAELARSKLGGAYDRAKVICERSEGLEALSQQAGAARCKLESVGDRAKQLHSLFLSSQGSAEKTREAAARLQPTESQGFVRVMKEQVVQSVQSAKSSSRVVADKLLDGRQRLEKTLQKMRPESRLPAGTDVEVTATFQGSSNGAYNTTVASGTHGTVLSVDIFGHAQIRFGAQDVWVYPSQFKNLHVATHSQPASDCGSESEDSMADEEMRDLCQRYCGALYAASLGEAPIPKAGHRSDASTTSTVSSDFGSQDAEEDLLEETVELKAGEVVQQAFAPIFAPALAKTAISCYGDEELPCVDSELGSGLQPTTAAPRPWQCRPSTATWLMPAPIDRCARR